MPVERDFLMRDGDEYYIYHVVGEDEQECHNMAVEQSLTPDERERQERGEFVIPENLPMPVKVKHRKGKMIIDLGGERIVVEANQ